MALNSTGTGPRTISDYGFLLLLPACIVFGAFPCNSDARENVYWVFFSDRGPHLEERLDARDDELIDSPSWERRAGVGLHAADEFDLYPWQGYVDAVVDIVGNIRTESRYLNAVSVVASEVLIDPVCQLCFVDRVEPVGGSSWVPVPESPVTRGAGLSSGQLSQIGLDSLYVRGWNGNGVILAVLDSGFNLDHPAFEGIDILDQYDFVMDDPDPSQQPEDPPGQSDHGTKVLSMIGAMEENVYRGGAPSSLFLLAKTEEISDEYPAEEDLWVAGLEWVEESGADLVSSSLGYIEWYTWEDMDGNTAVTTIAADIAASRGMMVVNAVGNGGPGEGTLIAPSDGDSVFAVGAVDALGNSASFSSRGPTYDGRIKPDACARGEYAIFVASQGTGYSSGNGTSFATPLMASVTATLIQAHPEWTVFDVVDAVKATASKASSPDNSYGWGIANAYAALRYMSVTGCVRRSDTGEYLGEYPVAVSVAGQPSLTVETNSQGWFAVDPGILGEFTISGAGGQGNVIGVTGTVDSSGVEVEVFVDPVHCSLAPSVYPNPSTQDIYVGFDISDGPVDAVFTVYAITGEKVHTETRLGLPTGVYRAPLPGEAFHWDGIGDSDTCAASGVYFTRLLLGEEVYILKISFIR